MGHIVLAPGEDLDAEKAAHRFAGAFLVPAAVARQDLGNQRRNLGIPELLLLKHKYGLSAQAWVYRAQGLGIITSAAATALFRKFGQMGWRRQEPGVPVPEEAPMRMDRLVLRGLAENLISEARATELLGRPVQRFVEGVECESEHAGVHP